MADLSRTHILKTLLRPSWYESVVVIVTSIGLTAAIFVPMLYKHAGFATTLNLDSASGTEAYQSISKIGAAVNTSDAVSTVTVFMFWAFVGLVVFFLIDAGLRWAAAASSFLQSVRTARNKHSHIEVDGLERLTIRVGAATGLYLLFWIVSTWALPWVLLIAHQSLEANRLQATINLVGIALVISVVCHTAVILVRLALLRVRVFGSPLDAA
ncbi:hypothetical protein KDA23_03745 [Candidatus Saccharibacteria bacterium]|nr:hypothetical protein [Candidatus Saccharibacteria bacterium]